MAVLTHIAKPLLNDAIKAKRGLRRYRCGYIVVAEINPNPLTLCELGAKGLDARGETENLQLGRMQPMRKRVQVPTDLFDPQIQFQQSLVRLNRIGGHFEQ